MYTHDRSQNTFSYKPQSRVCMCVCACVCMNVCACMCVWCMCVADHSLPSPLISSPRRLGCWKPLPQWSGVSHPSWQRDLPWLPNELQRAHLPLRRLGFEQELKHHPGFLGCFTILTLVYPLITKDHASPVRHSTWLWHWHTQKPSMQNWTRRCGLEEF